MNIGQEQTVHGTHQSTQKNTAKNFKRKKVRRKKIKRPRKKRAKKVRKKRIKRAQHVHKPKPMPVHYNDPQQPLFAWPLAKDAYWISSFFGRRNLDDRGTTFHYGIDMAALKGTPVRAAAEGTIIEASFGNGYGKTVLIAHTAGYKTRYAHLNSIKVHVGQTVQNGQIIGTVGATGNVRGNGTDASHLHFEIQHHGRHINPLDYLP